MNIKEDFPILKDGLVYLDNAATTQKPRMVIDAVKGFYEEDYATIHRGLYPLSVTATRHYEAAREKVAELIGVPSNNLIFTSGTTEAINLVAHGLVLKKGDEILLTPHEHHSNIVPWQEAAKKVGAKVIWCKLNGDLTLDVDDIKKKLTKKTRVLAITHVSNVLGTINPLEEIIPHAKEHDTFVLVDGAQAVPHMRVHARRLGCDAYAFSSHKMYGPTGIGALFLKDLSLVPLCTGGDMIDDVTQEGSVFAENEPRRFEAGTPNITGAIGFAAAIDYIEKIGYDVIHAHEEQLLRKTWKALEEQPRVHLLGPAPETHRRAGLITFTIEGAPPHDVAEILGRQNVCIRAGKHCAHPLHQYLKLDEGTNRVSFAFYNSEEDVNTLLGALQKVQEVFK
ncbi:cysteine desulfurase [Candidatus Woesearchaeota archaeon]|nr:cysteine desulfurase [Candidatus Woesearchaeota archaeon]